MTHNQEFIAKIRLAIILIFATFSLFIFIQNIIHGLSKIPGYDFKLRYHEVECLRKGIDPYDIVTKQIPSNEYALFGTSEAKPGIKTLHVYTPWEYTFFLPFSFFPKNVSGTIFFILSVIALISIGAYSYYLGKNIRGDLLDGVLSASTALLLGNAVGEVLAVANYGAINAFLILMLILSLSSKHDILAGGCWALLMTKPQIGLLFAIPLLLKRRYITIGVAAAICLISTIPPALMCGKNPIVMIFEVPKGCLFEAENNGTMLIPSQAFKALKGQVDSNVLGMISMIIGASICFWLSWRLHKLESWLVIMAPVVVCAILWNYCKPHDRVILWLTQLLLAIEVIWTKNRKVCIFCVFLILLTAYPFVYDMSVFAKLSRRVSLALLIMGCWRLPNSEILNRLDCLKQKTR